MIQKIIRAIIYTLVFIIILIFLLPKELFYNLFEKELQRYNIVISNETRKEKLDFVISDAYIYYEGIQSLHIDRLVFKSLIFYTKVNIENIYFEDRLKNFIPEGIEKISFTYNILTLNRVYIEANGKFGEIKGELKLFDKMINIELYPSNSIKESDLIKYFRYENDRYKYEYKF